MLLGFAHGPSHIYLAKPVESYPRWGSKCSRASGRQSVGNALSELFGIGVNLKVVAETRTRSPKIGSGPYGVFPSVSSGRLKVRTQTVEHGRVHKTSSLPGLPGLPGLP
eukprot:s374_g14.t1